MKKLNSNELEKINGGFSWALAVGIAAVITFITGLLEGYSNPKECNIKE